MNKITEIILKSFGETTERAHECLHEKSNVHEIRWAYSVLITEKMLLDEFRTTDDTVFHFQEAIKILLRPGCIDYHAGELYEAWNVSFDHRPTSNGICTFLESTLREIIECIVREPWYEKLKTKPAFQAARSREKEKLKTCA